MGILLVCLPFLNSCDWEDLPTYEEAEISAVQFYYRWPSDNEKDPITQEPVVKEVRLNTTSEVNSESATIHVTVTVPEAGGGILRKLSVIRFLQTHYGDK